MDWNPDGSRQFHRRFSSFALWVCADRRKLPSIGVGDLGHNDAGHNGWPVVVILENRRQQLRPADTKPGHVLSPTGFTFHPFILGALVGVPSWEGMV